MLPLARVLTESGVLTPACLRRYGWLLPLVVLLALRLTAAGPWPEVASDLLPDPKLLQGTLPNGLRYAILPNAEPKDRISLRLLVAVGSLHEREDERGLAHFVEHMVFRGTRSHPGDTLIKLLERRGIGQGPDSNAFTNYNYTIYHLELPDAQETTLRLGLQTLREYAEEALFKAKFLAAERGVILSEKATRAKPDYLLSLSNFGFLWPDSRQVRRTPIGTDAVIKNCTREQLAAFYDSWYRPERMAIIVVGDVPAGSTAPLVQQVFAPLQARAPPREEPGDRIPSTSAGPNIHVYTHPAQVGTLFILEHPSPAPRARDTHARRVELLHLALAFTMFQSRLEKYSHQNEGTFVSPRVFVDYPTPEWQNVIASVTGGIANWRRVVADLEQEHRRAFFHGFSNEELRIARANYVSAYTQAVRSASSRPSEWLAGQLADCLLNGALFTTPEALQRDLAAEVEAATLADCLAAFRKAWSTKAPHVFVASNPEFSGRATEVAEVLNNSRKFKMDAPVNLAAAEFAYGDFGPPGQIARHEHVADLDVRLAELSNGVRFNFKPTQFVADIVDVYVRVGTGKLSQPAGQPGLDILASTALTGGGLRKHGVQELRDLLAGRALQVTFGVDTDALVFSGRSARRDLPLCLQVIAAYLTDAAYRPEVMKDAYAAFGSMYSSLAASPGGPITQAAQRVLAGGDARFGIPAPDELFSRNLTELAEWLEPQFKHGPIELAVVGDISWEEASAAATRTLGALPARQPRPASLEGATVRTAQPGKTLYVYFTAPALKQAALAWCWPVPDCDNAHQERRCRLLGELITERLRVRIREELGAAYSPAASLMQHEGFPGFSYLIAYVEVPPAQMQQVVRVVNQEINALGSKRIGDDEFQRVRQPMLRAREDDLHANSYWIYTVLRDAQQRPERLAATRDRATDTAAITSKELQSLAKRYLVSKNAFLFIAGPAQASGPAH